VKCPPVEGSAATFQKFETMKPSVSQQTQFESGATSSINQFLPTGHPHIDAMTNTNDRKLCPNSCGAGPKPPMQASGHAVHACQASMVKVMYDSAPH
jgi:hypothetical protein